MKKILSLVLALVMILTVAGALAQSPEQPNNGGSVVPADNTATTEEEVEIGIEFIGDTDASKAEIEKFKAAAEGGDVLAGLPEEIKGKVPDGFSTINELVTAKFTGDVSGVTDNMKIIVKFDTPYDKDAKVLVLIGILPEAADGEVEWNVFEGVGLEDGSVEVTVTKDVFEKVQDKPFLIGVISE